MKKKIIIGQKVQIDEHQSIAVSRKSDGNIQVNAQIKIEGRKWKTTKCTRDENNIVSSVICFSEEGAMILCELLYKELYKELKPEEGKP
jgi:hypothetical protein